jgi:hypothetical protein
MHEDGMTFPAKTIHQVERLRIVRWMTIGLVSNDV